MKTLTENDKIKCIADNALEKFKEVAKDWTNIKIDSNDKLFHFTEVDSRIRNEVQPFGRIHGNCGVKFKTQINRYRRKCGDSIDEESGSNRRKIAKELCFICPKKHVVDNNSYNEGGIARCETDSAVEKLHTISNSW